MHDGSNGNQYRNGEREEMELARKQVELFYNVFQSCSIFSIFGVFQSYSNMPIFARPRGHLVLALTYDVALVRLRKEGLTIIMGSSR